MILRLISANFISDPPSFKEDFSHSLTTVEGGNVNLHCQVTAANPEPNITWYSVTANHTPISYGANLSFSNISRSNAGKYYCIAGNGIGEAVTSKISSIDVQREYVYYICRSFVLFL